jgi:hypothetical protein
MKRALLALAAVSVIALPVLVFAQSEEFGGGSSATVGPDAGLNRLTLNNLTVNQDAGILGSLWVSGDAGIRGQLLVNGDAGIVITQSGVANQTVLKITANTDGIEMGTLGAKLWGDSLGNVNLGGGTWMDSAGITGRSTNKLVLSDDDGVSVNGTTFIFNNTNRPLYINDSEGVAIVGLATGSFAACNNTLPSDNLGTRGAIQYDTTLSVHKACDGTSYGEWPGSRGEISGALNFGEITNATCAELTQALTGAAANDYMACAWPAGLEAGLTGHCYVSAADVVTFRLCNITGAPINPASGTFGARAWK